MFTRAYVCPHPRSETRQKEQRSLAPALGCVPLWRRETERVLAFHGAGREGAMGMWDWPGPGPWDPPPCQVLMTASCSFWAMCAQRANPCTWVEETVVELENKLQKRSSGRERNGSNSSPEWRCPKRRGALTPVSHHLLLSDKPSFNPCQRPCRHRNSAESPAALGKAALQTWSTVSHPHPPQPQGTQGCGHCYSSTKPLAISLLPVEADTADVFRKGRGTTDTGKPASSRSQTWSP